MLFFILLAILIGGIVWGCIDDWCNCLPIIATTVGVAGIIISTVILCCSHIGVNAQIDRFNVRYETLVFQYENDIYDNDNDLGKRELMNDIQAWNEDLAYRQKIQDDFWVGIFYPNIYDQFKPIELTK